MRDKGMRDKATIKNLDLTKDELAAIEKIKQSATTPYRKHILIKEILGTNLCCICSEIPQLMVRYDIGGATRIEMYCQTCIKSVYERDDNNVSSEVLAKKYGCVIGEQPRTKYD